MRVRKTKNLEMLAAVAKGLRGLKEKVVFVGGATIDLYLSDPNVPDARATDDVDCVVSLARRVQYHDLESELRGLGFKHPMAERAPLCRWDFNGIQVDVMPTEGKVLGFSNRWYTDGVAHAESTQLSDGQAIAVFPIPYLLASKIEAFLDRGRDDFQASSDMEDIIAIIDGCADVKDKILRAPADVRFYLIKKFKGFLADERFLDAVHGNVRNDQGVDRAGRVLSILKEIVQG